MKNFIPLILIMTSLQLFAAQGGTGFKINQFREFQIDESTVIKEDGEVIPVTEAQGGTGYKIRYSVNNVSPNLLTGTFEEINLINIYKGPLLSVAPFNIFNINGLVNSQTFITNSGGTEDLKIGDFVHVSGYIDSNSLAIITRVKTVESLSEWKLSGFVENLSATQFNINNQVIEYQPSQIGSCNSSLADGNFVEVFATPVFNFSLNDTIDSVTEINCVDRSVNPGVAATVIVEGMIDVLLADNNFVLSGQTIEVNQTTKYIRGRAEDIQELIKVEIEGSLDEMTGVITADKVRFSEPRLNLTIPVEIGDVSTSNVNIAGVTFDVTPQTLDPDGVLINGLSETTQLQLKGYGFTDGELVITRVNDRGNADYNDVEINGDITEINEPEIEVSGIKVDTTFSNFIDENGLVITAAEFYSSILIGTNIEVEAASYDPVTKIISDGTVTIKEIAREKALAPTENHSGVDTVYGTGTITGLIDLIYSNSFE